MNKLITIRLFSRSHQFTSEPEIREHLTEYLNDGWAIQSYALSNAASGDTTVSICWLVIHLTKSVT